MGLFLLKAPGPALTGRAGGRIKWWTIQLSQAQCCQIENTQRRRTAEHFDQVIPNLQILLITTCELHILDDVLWAEKARQTTALGFSNIIAPAYLRSWSKCLLQGAQKGSAGKIGLITHWNVNNVKDFHETHNAFMNMRTCVYAHWVLRVLKYTIVFWLCLLRFSKRSWFFNL